MQSLRAAIALCALLALLVLSGSIGPMVVAQDADGYERWSRARLGDPAEAPPYAVELWGTQQPGRIQQDDPPSFRFELYWRGNGTRVVPGPDLQIFAFLCVAPERSDLPCDPEVEAETEAGFRLRDGLTSPPNGAYRWDPDPDRIFTEDGAWRVRVNFAERPVNNSAVFVLTTTDILPEVPGIFAELIERLFGAEGGVPSRIAVMLLWLTLFFVVGRLVTRTARRTFLSPSRVDPTVGKLAVRLFASVWAMIGLAWALWVVWRIDFWAGLTALGLLSVALGFGMQNTVANLMGGINLAADKPFIIGDRIQVGETWGDVQEIGLRSTKIMTTKKEVVIVPNKLLDEREIWNYTRDHQELRLDVDAGISYDSDRRLAEALMITCALEHPGVLSYPRPRVFLQRFGDFSIDLQLRCWLQVAKDARLVASDLRKAIKDKFDESGVEIPFPYRTMVYKKELDEPHTASDDELRELAAREIDLPRMLYATAGPPQVHSIADFVGKIAKELDVYLVVLYVTKPDVRTTRAEEYRVFSAFQDAARAHTIPLKTVHRRGDVVTEIKATIKDEDIDILGMGAHRHAIIPTPKSMADFTKEIRQTVQIPVLIVPRSLQIPERTLNHYRNLVEERHLAKVRKRTGIVSEKDVGRGAKRPTRREGKAAAKKEDEPVGTSDSAPDEDAEWDLPDEDAFENGSTKEDAGEKDMGEGTRPKKD